MSEDDSLTLSQKAYRSVTPETSMHPNIEMDSIGWTMFLVLIVLMLPLLPFLIIVYALSKGFDYLAGQRGSET